MCTRYPYRRPSDYLELNEVDGFALDIALAAKFGEIEKETRLMQLDSIQEGFANVCRALGSKISRTAYKPRVRASEVTDELPDLGDVLKQLGSGVEGFVVSRGDK